MNRSRNYIEQNTDRKFLDYLRIKLPTTGNGGGSFNPSITNPQLGDVIKWNGSAWVNGIDEGEDIAIVANYAALPDPTTVPNKFYAVTTSTGIPYITPLFGGTYRPKGFYLSDGVQWIYMGEFPIQATQSEVNAGTVTDKFVSPSTLKESSFVLPPGGTFSQILQKKTSTDYDVEFIDPTFEDEEFQIMNELGANLLSQTTSIITTTTATALSDTQSRFQVIRLRKAAIISGVKWYQRAQGNYTADQNNKFALYSYDKLTGLLTKVAESANNGDLWKQAANSFGTAAFTSPYNAAAGIYYIALLYNSSAQTTAPSIAGIQVTAAQMGTLYSNSAKLICSANYADLPTSVNISTLPAFSFYTWLALY